jgi:hypothetical protein
MSLRVARLVDPWWGGKAHRTVRPQRQSLAAYIRAGSLRSLISAPIVYSLVLPFALLDAWTTLYQWVCFPIYGVARVHRTAYFVLDRHKLAYLNAIEKANCTYCTYANGVLAYVREVAARTEQYWCPIKHGRAIRAPHRRYRRFVAYGDASGYRQELTPLREALRENTVPRAQRRDKGRRR